MKSRAEWGYKNRKDNKIPKMLLKQNCLHCDTPNKFEVPIPNLISPMDFPTFRTVFKLNIFCGSCKSKYPVSFNHPIHYTQPKYNNNTHPIAQLLSNDNFQVPPYLNVSALKLKASYNTKRDETVTSLKTKRKKTIEVFPIEESSENKPVFVRRETIKIIEEAQKNVSNETLSENQNSENKEKNFIITKDIIQKYCIDTKLLCLIDKSLSDNFEESVRFENLEETKRFIERCKKLKLSESHIGYIKNRVFPFSFSSSSLLNSRREMESISIEEKKKMKNHFEITMYEMKVNEIYGTEESIRRSLIDSSSNINNAFNKNKMTESVSDNNIDNMKNTNISEREEILKCLTYENEFDIFDFNEKIIIYKSKDLNKGIYKVYDCENGKFLFQIYQKNFVGEKVLELILGESKLGFYYLHCPSKSKHIETELHSIKDKSFTYNKGKCFRKRIKFSSSSINEKCGKNDLSKMRLVDIHKTDKLNKGIQSVDVSFEKGAKRIRIFDNDVVILEFLQNVYLDNSHIDNIDENKEGTKLKVKVFQITEQGSVFQRFEVERIWFRNKKPNIEYKNNTSESEIEANLKEIYNNKNYEQNYSQEEEKIFTVANKLYLLLYKSNPLCKVEIYNFEGNFEFKIDFFFPTFLSQKLKSSENKEQKNEFIIKNIEFIGARIFIVEFENKQYCEIYKIEKREINLVFKGWPSKTTKKFIFDYRNFFFICLEENLELAVYKQMVSYYNDFKNLTNGNGNSSSNSQEGKLRERNEESLKLMGKRNIEEIYKDNGINTNENREANGKLESLENIELTLVHNSDRKYSLIDSIRNVIFSIEINLLED